MVTDSGADLQPLGFAATVRRRAGERGSWLCLGLDPDPDQLPASVPRTTAGVEAFCRAVIESTSDCVAAYKINFAFFEALGPEGWRAIEAVRSAIPADVPVIADAKRGDIPNTARFYAQAIFDSLGFDAATVNPYLGWDSVQPFLQYSGRGVFVLARTSNPGGADLQNLVMGGEPLYLRVAREALSRGGADTGLVVGATEPEALRQVRGLDQRALLLVVGVGAQGGNLDEARIAGANRDGQNALFGVSRHILYASRETDYAEAARRAAMETVAALEARP